MYDTNYLLKNAFIHHCIWKTTLAGAALTLCIEITQILSYERCSDIDDIILNTAGAFLGAVIYFSIKKVKSLIVKNFCSHYNTNL